jgi:hypothetical protein
MPNCVVAQKYRYGAHAVLGWSREGFKISDVTPTNAVNTKQRTANVIGPDIQARYQWSSAAQFVPASC